MSTRSWSKNLDAVTAAATGSPVPVNGPTLGYQVVWTGTLAGTVTIQGSIDGDTWTTLATPGTQPTSGGGNYDEGWSDCYARFVRTKLASVSGTGTCTTYLTTI